MGRSMPSPSDSGCGSGMHNIGDTRFIAMVRIIILCDDAHKYSPDCADVVIVDISGGDVQALRKTTAAGAIVEVERHHFHCRNLPEDHG